MRRSLGWLQLRRSMKADFETRIEHDVLGDILVSSNRKWGAQTQRSLLNFNIGRNSNGSTSRETMPLTVIKALALIKQSAASVNSEIFGILDNKISFAIQTAAQEVLDGALDAHFPLVIWQTGSGTQSNMNVNEVIAHRANEILNDNSILIHPNDHVNMSQSSNDTFPSAMHIAVVLEMNQRLIPGLEHLGHALDNCVSDFKNVVKVGRTHMQDATPISLSQEFGTYSFQVHTCLRQICDCKPRLLELAQGGTAVGTGMNSPEGFDHEIVKVIAKKTGCLFVPSLNKFEAISSHGHMLEFHSGLNTLATTLSKICNDIVLSCSGPRCGLGELMLPENEAGSSMMPGKVNPTQCEALLMISAQVMGNHCALSIANSNGQFQLNAYKPMMVANVLQSLTLLGDGCDSFAQHCIEKLRPNQEIIKQHLESSLMLVTSLSPHIGYEKAAVIAKQALTDQSTLREAATKLRFVSPDNFDKWADPRDMLFPSLIDALCLSGHERA